MCRRHRRIPLIPLLPPGLPSDGEVGSGVGVGGRPPAAAVAAGQGPASPCAPGRCSRNWASRWRRGITGGRASERLWGRGRRRRRLARARRRWRGVGGSALAGKSAECWGVGASATVHRQLRASRAFAGWRWGWRVGWAVLAGNWRWGVGKAMALSQLWRRRTGGGGGGTNNQYEVEGGRWKGEGGRGETITSWVGGGVIICNHLN